MKHKNKAHMLMLQATPILICWNLWKNGCAIKYGAKTSNGTRVNDTIFNDNFKLITSLFPLVNWPPTWCEIIKLAERCIQAINVKKITWTIPHNLFIKINTYGSALEKTVKIG